jgi:DNA sulfur modification protein DndC
MIDALAELHKKIGQKILMITGVRQGESSIRDGRISMSCSKDGSECGQGWYQTGMDSASCSTLAPIIHWRVCLVWDWLKIYAPSQKYGAWHTTMVADAYGGDDAEDINARTGCQGCPLASKDKALITVCKMKDWAYLSPLLELKQIYREMKKPKHRIRMPGGQKKKDGNFAKNQQRMGPLRLESRKMFLEKIIDIQSRVNNKAIKINRPTVDFINQEEIDFINKLIENNTWPDGWTGSEPLADKVMDKFYSDGSVMPFMFKEMM